MTELVTVITLIVGVISTIYYFFNAGEYGWGAFFASLVATAVLSLVIKIYDMCSAALQNSITTINQLNSINDKLHRLDNDKKL